ncbi:MAG: hypothetical protein JW990_14185, partial [Thermoleophilia bacterium]|nr:hypothetical protein [Thermoleophilia bacterium]
LVSMESVEAGWPEAADLDDATADRAGTDATADQAASAAAEVAALRARVAELGRRLEGREP